VPRQIDIDDEMPRRRRRTRTVAIEAEVERGVMMRILLHSPKDMMAGLLAVAAVCAIFTNALFLQAGRHPSPMFGSVVALPAPAVVAVNPLPRPRPAEALTRPADSGLLEPRPVEIRTADPRATEARTSEPRTVDSKTFDPMTNLVVKATGGAPASSANVARPPAPIPSRGEGVQTAASRRIAAVQRALTEYGYGQLKPTGSIGSDTLAAIQKFERDRKLPVTGQVSDRMVRELSAVIGHPVD